VAENSARIGVIGGSGLYQMEGLSDVREVRVDTPFGPPSDAIVIGTLEGERAAFLPRHGRGHRLMPGEVPSRANIYALKSLGVERLISISAVGSLREDFRPLDLVVPDQLIDRTRGRASTFFGDGIVAHISFGDPFCPELRSLLHTAASRTGDKVHPSGTCVAMEGPAFSTRAESRMYQAWGADIIGMTALPEAKLAREAEICYATLACVTDYDCWRQSEAPVDVAMIVENLRRNVATAQEALRRLVPTIPAHRKCPCATSLAGAIITTPDHISRAARERLSLIAGKYLD